MVPRRPFGPTAVEVPVLGQGTWQLRDAAAAEAALAEGMKHGMTHIDTAELYRGSEQVVARALRGRREAAFVVSKVLPHHASYDGTVAACDQSLARLATDHLDVYLLHWRTDEHPLAETMRALERLVDDGKTRFLGVSNFDVDDLKDARKALRRHPIVCDQVLYHLGDRRIENELLPWCAKERIAVVAYSPFGSTGGFPAPGSRRRKVLDEVGRRHGKTAYQVALRFLARHPSVFVIPKAESVAHARENAAAMTFDLSEKDLEEIDAAFPVPKEKGISFL